MIRGGIAGAITTVVLLVVAAIVAAIGLFIAYKSNVPKIVPTVLEYRSWLETIAWLPAWGFLGGAWLGWRRYRLIFWFLNTQALGVRRGYLWQSESRVPISRVQHLDLQRGPLQRLFNLATLVVHTAGTQMNTVAITDLDVADAQRLRDRLARQLDCDDAL